MAQIAQALAVAPSLSQGLALSPTLAHSLHVLTLSCEQLNDLVEEAALSNPFLEVEPPRFPNVGGDVDFERPEVPTLAAHLSQQIATLGLAAPVAQCARAIAASLESRGRLSDPDDLARALPFANDVFVHALSVVKGLEPVGVGARDLRECLTLQLADKPDGLALLDHLDLVAASRLDRLQRVLAWPRERLAEALRMLRSVPSDPTAGFDLEHRPIAPPDVIVEAVGAGWNVSVNAQAAPRVRVGPTVEGAGDYARVMRAEASDLVRALTRRSHTLARVAREIVRRQDAFLLHGPARLEPMAMADVAAALDIHVSTVSRAVQGKAIELPAGQVAMRRLFQAEVRGHSADAIQARLADIVATERKSAPLRDADIASELARGGIAISRRTVAKYRSRMGLPDAATRARSIVGGVAT